MLSAESILAAVHGKRLSPDAVRSLAYLLCPTRSDIDATRIGREIAAGKMSSGDASRLMQHSGDISIFVWDEIEESDGDE